MRDKRAPWFPFYPCDWIGDPRVQEMTDAQQGRYMRLLCQAWTDGSIPNDPDRLARRLRVDPTEFGEQDWPVIGPCWSPDPDNPGRLVQGRLEHERERQERRRQTNSENGKKGAKARWPS